MTGKRKKVSGDRARALDLWQAPPGAGEPLICLATTFTFDATFFETQCLGRFLQMESEPHETDAVGYLIEREEKLASARVCVLVDRQHATSKESLRWDVVPVALRRAILHAKVAVLCWANHVRLIVGSGNLTEPGYRKNVEVFGSIDVSRVDGGLINVVLGCVDFLEHVLGYGLGAEDQGPRRRAREMLAAVRTHVRHWPPHEERERVVPVFAGVGRSLFEQLAEVWPSSSPPRYAHILSPFYDEAGNGKAVVAGLLQTMAKRRPRGICFYALAAKLPDGRLQVGMPRETVVEAQAQADVEVYEVRAEQDEEIRPLHAKMLVLGNEEWELVLVGSSNFTRAGFGIRAPTGQPGNLEANLAYIAREGEAELKRLDRVWPEVEDEPVDLTSKKIVWLPTNESEGEQAAAAVLPAAFEEALFDASGSRRLILRLGGDLPEWWQVRDADGRLIVDSADWDGKAKNAEFAWGERQVPFELSVEWRARNGDAFAASWPVNALDPASLPPPDALASLSLEELIEVLSSTRPLHQAVVQALRKRSKRNSYVEDLLDPHKRVNTETFLLRRTKRVALALERLRERLERPVLTSDALDWRLRGPVGPIALAKAFTSESRSPGEAAFCLAELALALKRVRAERAAVGGLAAKQVREQVRDCIREVEQFTKDAGLQAPPAIERYVQGAFAEAKR